MNQKQYLKSNGSVKIRDWSVPLETQKEVGTSYGSRLFSVTSFDFDLQETAFDLIKYENELIRTWREMAKNPYISFAIDDIINEMISITDEEVFPIKLELSNTNFSDNIKTKVQDEFNEILKILQFHKKSYTLLRDWYIDGKAYFFIEFSKNKKTIQNITVLDPLRTKKVVSEKNGKTETTYVYQDIDLTQTLFEIPENQIVELSSGLMDDKHRVWISYLDKAYIPLNQVTSIEDALVIYRIARAPERRVFYIDVGELPKSKAEQYMRETINNYKNRMEYDPSTGTIKEKVRHMCMLDDIFLPRRDGTRGTEVDTLAGASGGTLGETGDLDYFLKKLFRSLNIPFSRWGGDEAQINVIGRGTEITRDELKYNKFITRLRQQYSTLFYILLRSSLELKNIIKAQELDEERDAIIFLWNSDSMFSMFKSFDIISEKADILERIMPHVGKLVSLNWVKKEVLRMTDEEIKEMDKQIEKEKPIMKDLNINQEEEFDEAPSNYEEPEDNDEKDEKEEKPKQKDDTKLTDKMTGSE